jgi:hypothetical protein
MSSKLAAALYSWAWKLAKKTGVFSASAENVAEYFGVHRNTAQAALDELAWKGFFRMLECERFKPNVDELVDHRAWAKRHPHRCVGKISYHYTASGDPLGKQLHAISGQRARFLPNQVTGLRNLGLTDEQIEAEWREFMKESDYTGKQWKRAPFDFHAKMKDLVAVTAGATNG